MLLQFFSLFRLKVQIFQQQKIKLRKANFFQICFEKKNLSSAHSLNFSPKMQHRNRMKVLRERKKVAMTCRHFVGAGTKPAFLN
jgi:hypothetical protein